MMRFLFVFLLINCLACGQQKAQKPKVNPQAKRLNDSAIQTMINTSDYEKGIALLDQAIAIDSNYYVAYNNKLSFQLMMKKYEEALPTLKNLNRLRPADPQFYFTTGILYEQLGDTIISQKYFTDAGIYYDKILDTMKEENKS